MPEEPNIIAKRKTGILFSNENLPLFNLALGMFLDDISFDNKIFKHFFKIGVVKKCFNHI